MNVPEVAWQQLGTFEYSFLTRWLIGSCILQMGSRSILAVVAVALVAGVSADINTIVGNFALNLVRRNCNTMAVPCSPDASERSCSSGPIDHVGSPASCILPPPTGFGPLPRPYVVSGAAYSGCNLRCCILGKPSLRLLVHCHRSAWRQSSTAMQCTVMV